MIDIAFYSLVELLTAFSPNFATFLLLRALYGVAMGGEWGLGAAMTMEALPPQRRGVFSGILQSGYMAGYLLAALAYFVVFHFTHWDWRALFVIGTLPALLIFFIRSSVPESPAWLAARARNDARPRRLQIRSVLAHWPLFVYTVVFMTALNGMSHGTQDLYATFLQKQRGFAAGTTATLAIVAAFGAMTGSMTFGTLSQRLGRRPIVMLCAVLAACAIPLWAFGPSALWLAAGAFVIQFAIQGCWGVIPAHLNELSPPGARGTFPGFTYQLGNLFASPVAQLEATLAQRLPLAGGLFNYAAAMAWPVLGVLLCVFALSALGYLVRDEARNASFVEAGT